MKKEMNWYDVSLFQFLKLQELTKIEDETERVLNIAELLLGTEVTNLPLVKFTEEIKKLSFLNTEVPESIPPKHVEVNNRKYSVDCLLGNITTAQYVDYTNHAKSNDAAKMLSVFIIPEGHKYNDGYDMLQVINDINDLPVPIVNSIAFFFVKQLVKFMEIFQSYSIKQLKKMKIPKELKKNLIQVLQSITDLG